MLILANCLSVCMNVCIRGMNRQASRESRALFDLQTNAVNVIKRAMRRYTDRMNLKRRYAARQILIRSDSACVKMEREREREEVTRGDCCGFVVPMPLPDCSRVGFSLCVGSRALSRYARLWRITNQIHAAQQIRKALKWYALVCHGYSSYGCCASDGYNVPIIMPSTDTKSKQPLMVRRCRARA